MDDSFRAEVVPNMIPSKPALSSTRKRRRSSSASNDTTHGPNLESYPAMLTGHDVAPLVWSLDCGTMNAALACLDRTQRDPRSTVRLRDITLVKNYPNQQRGWGQIPTTVPVALWYVESEGKKDVRWGWTVIRSLQNETSDIHRVPEQYLTNFKLLLDSSEETKDIRDGLMKKVQYLRRKKFIEHVDDIFVTFFECWLRHARGQIPASQARRPHFVLCAPSTWLPPSYQRWLRAFHQAVGKVWSDHSPQDLPQTLTISEPAASASCYLGQSIYDFDMKDGETNLIADGGAGTFEIITYMKAPSGYYQICEPSGDSCGGNTVNERFKKLAREKLEPQKENIVFPEYGITFDAIVESCDQHLEREIKRCDPSDLSLVPIHVAGLQPDAVQGFKKDKWELSIAEYHDLWKEPLRMIRELFAEQYARVREAGFEVDYVTWSGMFCDSPAIRETGSNLMAQWDETPKHIWEEGVSGHAVTRGGIFSALRQNCTYSEKLNAGLAVKRFVEQPWEAGGKSKLERHPLLRLKYIRDPTDGKNWADTLDWFAQKGQQWGTASVWSFSTTHHITGRALDDTWVVREEMFGSSRGDERQWRPVPEKSKYIFSYGTASFNLDILKQYASYLRVFYNNNGDKVIEICLEVVVRPLPGFLHDILLQPRWISYGPCLKNVELDSVRLNMCSGYPITAV